MNGLADPVLVTGATGFIGRRVAARLVAEGHQVRALVLPNERTDGLLPPAAEIRRGDVTDRASVEAAAQGAATIFHLAAVVGDWGPDSLFDRVTVAGTRHVLGAAAQSGARTVLVSSLVVYGDAIGRDVCDEDHPLGAPLGPYSRSKLAQEAIARDLHTTKKLPVTIVRPTNVFGPASRPWVDEVAIQLRRGMPALIGGGDFDAGLCYVDNLVDLLLRAAATPAAIGRTYNAADALGITWARYFTDLAALLGVKKPRALPLPLATLLTRITETTFRALSLKTRPPLTRESLNIISSHHRVPIDRARRDLSYTPLVPYQDALAAIATYLRSAP